MRDYLKKGIEILGVSLEEKMIDNLLLYLELLLEYNAHTNITAIRDREGIIEKHFIDSLTLQNYIKKEDEKALDIGTGAGFPGMVLGICNPNLKVTLVDSVSKKTKFLKIVKEKLNLQNIEIVTGRVEDIITDDLRESYSLGFCRGVSKLSTILEYMIPFIEINGRFLVQKSSDTGEEIEAKNALHELKSTIEYEEILKLPYCRDERKIIIVRKNEVTEKKYPRKRGNPLKRPL